MTTEPRAQVHPIQCRCGAFRGELVVTRAANHAVCYCQDCRTYAHVLGNGRELLDSLGGTEVIATLPQHVRFLTGHDKLACLSLSPRGALRWYANCCNTPLANTPRDFRIPYAGVVRACLENGSAPLDDVFGPVRMRVNTSSVKGRVSTTPVGAFFSILKFLSWLVPARVSGAYRQTPFFDAVGSPVAAVNVISQGERDRARYAALNGQLRRGAT
jgi:hypothetical protein